jgi:hypothetical protein
MITKELLKTEIDQIQEQYLEVLYKFIKTLQQPQNIHQPSLMSKLKQIKIHAPSDFAKNIDAYLNGAKNVE